MTDGKREDKARRMAHQTHTDRVNELNKKLEGLSDHHDMPRVSLRVGSADCRLVLDKSRGTLGCRRAAMQKSNINVLVTDAFTDSTVVLIQGIQICDIDTTN